MSRAKNFLKNVDFLEQENKHKQENAEVGPSDEDIFFFIANALAGEKEYPGVKVRAEKSGPKKSPLNIEADMLLGGKQYHIEAEIRWTGLKITSIE